MDSQIPEHHPLRKLFCSLTERSFADSLGWPDFNVTEYLTNLLVEFAHVDLLYRITNEQEKSLETVVELLYESEVLQNASSFDREREVHRHIGDFTLFMTGIFPEYLRRIKSNSLIYHKDFLVDYLKTGKRSYAIVARFQTEGTKEHPSLYRKLSDNFELCVTGLGLVRLDLDRMQNPTYRKAKNILLH